MCVCVCVCVCVCARVCVCEYGLDCTPWNVHSLLLSGVALD